jgi:AraC family transcriptional regulator
LAKIAVDLLNPSGTPGSRARPRRDAFGSVPSGGSVGQQRLEGALRDRLEHGIAGRMISSVLANGDGWGVADVLCTSGPDDRPFEERHSIYSIAIVLAGSFQYRSSLGRSVMTPGSLMLGNPGQCFECGHEHAAGDRCISFWFTPEYFERIAAEAGARGRQLQFSVGRLPPVRALAALVADAGAAVAGRPGVSWEEVSVRLITGAVQLANGASPDPIDPAPDILSRVTRTIRAIEGHADEALTLGRLAGFAGLSPYHFLRTFERVTGITPHQYILRTRLRQAAMRIALESGRILDIALESGFGDVSNFNRAFRSEFGLSPRRHRRSPG